MKSLLPAIVVLIGCHAAKPIDITAEVKAAAGEFDQAQLHGDRATLERYLASDFVFARPSGVLSDRKVFIDNFTDPATKLDPFTIIHPVFVRLGADAAIVGGESTLTGTDHGAQFSQHLRYADVFARRDGRWQVVYTQVTTLAN